MIQIHYPKFGHPCPVSVFLPQTLLLTVWQLQIHWCLQEDWKWNMFGDNSNNKNEDENVKLPDTFCLCQIRYYRALAFLSNIQRSNAGWPITVPVALSYTQHSNRSWNHVMIWRRAISRGKLTGNINYLSLIR